MTCEFDDGITWRLKHEKARLPILSRVSRSRFPGLQASCQRPDIVAAYKCLISPAALNTAHIFRQRTPNVSKHSSHSCTSISSGISSYPASPLPHNNITRCLPRRESARVPRRRRVSRSFLAGCRRESRTLARLANCRLEMSRSRRRRRL